MKALGILFTFLMVVCGASEKELGLTELKEGELVESQDELSAETQELIELQTQEKVIQTLEQMESSMVSATLRLLDGDTGGETIAIQTDIIEKAYQSAKQKQQSQSSLSDTDQALMDTLEKMLGKSSQKGKKQAQKSGGDGNGGNPAEGEGKANKAENEFADENSSKERSVPHLSPSSGDLLPIEFQELIDNYNE